MAVRSFDRLLINGEWRTPSSGRRLDVVSPHREEVLATTPLRVISEENGSPITFSNMAQAGSGIAVLSAFLQVAQDFPWESERVRMVDGTATVRHEPVGVVAAITTCKVKTINPPASSEAGSLTA